MWHIYLQEEKAHMDKIKAFTERFKESVEVSEEEKNIIESYFVISLKIIMTGIKILWKKEKRILEFSLKNLKR